MTFKFTIGDKDMSQYIRSATINVAPLTDDQWGWSAPIAEPVEPAKLSDCPHKPGTVEHRDWVRTNVLDRQTDPRTDAYRQERERIGGLISDRRVLMDNDRARRAEELEAMIANLPEPGVDIPPDPPRTYGVIHVDEVWGTSPLDAWKRELMQWKWELMQAWSQPPSAMFPNLTDT